MAESENSQANAENKPVKKRRFFRPRPKKAAEEGAEKNNPQQPKAEKPSKPKQPPKPKVVKAVQEQQGQPKQGPRAEGAKTNQQVKPKQGPKPKVERTEKPIQAPKAKDEVSASKSNAKQIKPATKAAQTVKTNGNFRPRRPKEAPKLHLSDIDFKYLNVPEFADVYALVTKAQSYFETDNETCCAKFRIANEAIIARLIETLQLKEAADKNTFEQINLLSEKIPADMVNSNIFSEMHNIRMIGNSFVHNDDKYDATKGAKTCLIAMEKICQWLVEFEPKYKSYQRAKAATSSTFMESLANIFKGFISIFKGK